MSDDVDMVRTGQGESSKNNEMNSGSVRVSRTKKQGRLGRRRRAPRVKPHFALSRRTSLPLASLAWYSYIDISVHNPFVIEIQFVFARVVLVPIICRTRNTYLLV
jgi:hypothetical protein